MKRQVKKLSKKIGKILRPITKPLKKFWVYLSGKKRTIALTYWALIVPAITIMWPEGAPSEVTKVSGMVGLILSYIGLGHAAAKKMSSPKAEETDALPNTTE